MTDGIHRLGRRLFLRDLGRGTLAVAVLGPTVVACTSDSVESTEPTVTTSSTTEPDGTTTTTSSTTTTEPPEDEQLRWERVALGFVSAYVLVRGDEAAIVDTGVEGSEDEILVALERAGLGWDAVEHVILTHAHPDHVGSISAVLDAAEGATGYAGAADLEAITVDRDLEVARDGATIFGLDIIATPGHTPGHISVFDEASGVLVAGDAVVGADDGGLAGPDPRFTDDLSRASMSVELLAALEVDTVLLGHGEPVVGNGGAELAGLVADA